MAEAMVAKLGLRAHLSTVEVDNRKNMPGQDPVTDAFAALLAGVLSGTGSTLLSFEFPEQTKQIEPTVDKMTLSITENIEPTVGNDFPVPVMTVDTGLENAGLGLEESVSLVNGQPCLFPDLGATFRSEDEPDIADRFMATTEKEHETNDAAIFYVPENLSDIDKVSAEEPSGPTIKQKTPDLTRAETISVDLKDEELLWREKHVETKTELIQKAKLAQEGSHEKEQPVQFSLVRQFATSEGAKHDEDRLSVNEATRLFRQALEQASQQKRNGRQEVYLELDPPDLGRVHLTLLHRTGVVSARFEVENDLAHGTLQSNMAELKESLVQQGIQVEELSVFIGQADIGNNEFAQRQGGFSPGQERFFRGVQQLSVVSDDDTNGYERTLRRSSLDLLV